MIRLVALMICCFSYNYSMSCTCFMARKISVEALLYDDLVFQGYIISIDTVYGEYKNRKYPQEIMATFKVDVWISTHDVPDTVTVFTGVGVGDCGLAFAVGERWLIYTHEFDGIQSTSICTPSKRMADKEDKEFQNTLAYLKKLKSTTGYNQEKDEWYQGPYIIMGNLNYGKPVGQWLRIRDNDTIAIFNFNDEGKRRGYQMEKNEDYDVIFESFEVATDSICKTFSRDGKKLRSFYEMKNGLRHGKFEVYWSEELHLTATYVNGQLHGEYVTWHEDSAIAKGKIKTVKQFENGKIINSIQFDEGGNVIK